MSNIHIDASQLSRPMDSASFLAGLKYEGFEPKHVIAQAKTGVSANPDGLSDDIIANAASRLNTNAAMPFGAAQEMDKVILQAITAKPRIYTALQAAGCIANFNFGTYLARYSRSNLAEQPTTAMDFTYQGGDYSNASQSQGDYEDVVTPIPLQFYNWTISKRQIAAADNTSSMFGGLALESQEVRLKTVGLADAQERIIWNGNQNIKLNGQPLTGILNNSVVVANATAITLSISQPDLFIESFLSGAIQPLINQNYDQSNLMVFYSSNMSSVFQMDYLGQLPTQTITNRLLSIDGIIGVQPTQYLNSSTNQVIPPTSGTLVVIKMEPQVIDLAVESNIAVAQYATNPMCVKYAMFAACAPRVKVDYYGKVGIQLVTVTISA